MTTPRLTRRQVLRLAGIGIGMSVLAACQPSTPATPTAAPQAASTGKTGGPIIIAHELGTLTLPKPASRVATLQFQFLEALLALDVAPTAQADEQQPGGLPQLPVQIGGAVAAKGWKWTSLGNRVKPNLEVLATSNVEVIIANLQEHRDAYPTLNKIAPTLVQDTNSWSKLLPNLDAIAQALGVTDKAAMVRKDVQDAIDTARSKAKPGAAPPRVLVSVLTPDKFFAYGANSLQAGMVSALGATYVYKEVGDSITEAISLEALPDLKADVIIGTAFPYEKNVTDLWGTNPIWQGLSAVQAKRIHIVNRDIWALGRGVISVKQMVAEATPFLYPA
jgi:ABC-type Fe3+-hydroxamate transport system substrate-binding protein